MLKKLKEHKMKLSGMFILFLSNAAFSQNIRNLNHSGRENVFKDLIQILATIAYGMKWVILAASLVIFAFNVIKHVSQREPDYSAVFAAISQLLIILAITFNIEKFVLMIYGITI